VEKKNDNPVNLDLSDSTKVVAVDLEFMFDVFFRQGSDIELTVVKGIPEGATAVAAGIIDGALVVVFDREVPETIWYKQIQRGVKDSKDLN